MQMSGTMLAELEVQKTITMAEVGFHHGFVVSAGTTTDNTAQGEERKAAVARHTKMRIC